MSGPQRARSSGCQRGPVVHEDVLPLPSSCPSSSFFLVPAPFAHPPLCSYFSVRSLTVRSVLARRTPMSLDEMLAKRLRFIAATQALRKKNKTLKESLTPSQLEYMMVRLARRQASILANDFTLITHERPKTTHKLIFGYLLLLTCPSFCFFLVLPIAAFLSFLFPLPIPLQVPVGLQER